jgi:hypothetical protein
MDIITGYVGSPHVTAEQDRDINIGIFGAESYVLRTGSQLKAEVSSNNEIKIRDGVIMHQGCAASIKKNTYDSLTIVNGSQGMKRIDLVVARYSRNQSTKVESLTLKVIQGTPVTGTPSAPGYTTGDIQAGDLIADMPLYQVVINGLNITAVKQVFNTVDTVAELNGKLEEKKYSISQGGSLAIRNQRITKKNNRVSIMAGLYTTGLGNANTRYNGGSIPAEIAPPGSGAFPAIVTKDNWTLIGIGCVIIETNGAITYQINSSFQKDTYIWLDVSYDL